MNFLVLYMYICFGNCHKTSRKMIRWEVPVSDGTDMQMVSQNRNFIPCRICNIVDRFQCGFSAHCMLIPLLVLVLLLLLAHWFQWWCGFGGPYASPRLVIHIRCRWLVSFEHASTFLSALFFSEAKRTTPSTAATLPLSSLLTAIYTLLFWVQFRCKSDTFCDTAWPV